MSQDSREIESILPVSPDRATPMEAGAPEISLETRFQTREVSICRFDPAQEDSAPQSLATGTEKCRPMSFAELPPRTLRTLQQIKQKVSGKLAMIKRSYSHALSYAKDIGEQLARIDEVVPYGASTRARGEICQELGISDRNGRYYMQIFLHWPEIEAAMAEEALPGETCQFSIRQALGVIKPVGRIGKSPKKGRKKAVAYNAQKVSHLLEPAARLGESPTLVPGCVLTPALELVGGEFTIDATSEPACERVPAELHYTNNNALHEEWLGSVFAHLEAGPDILKWVEAVAFHLMREADPVTECVLLLPSQPEAGWFERLVGLDASVVFCRERLVFHGETATCEYAHLVAYVGHQHDRFANLFQDMGPVVRTVRSAQ